LVDTGEILQDLEEQIHMKPQPEDELETLQLAAYAQAGGVKDE
jgi:hypothetical protein